MAKYFIEQGQGVVGRQGDDLRVETSALHSCTLIAGYNAQTGVAGAFHYPARSLEVDPATGRVRDQATVNAMNAWMQQVNPQGVTLVAAAPTPGYNLGSSTAGGISGTDLTALRGWLGQYGIAPNEISSNVGVMEMTRADGFRAGTPNHVSQAFYSQSTVNLAASPEGRVPGHPAVLVGRNVENEISQQMAARTSTPSYHYSGASSSSDQRSRGSMASFSSYPQQQQQPPQPYPYPQPQYQQQPGQHPYATATSPYANNSGSNVGVPPPSQHPYATAMSPYPYASAPNVASTSQPRRNPYGEAARSHVAVTQTARRNPNAPARPQRPQQDDSQAKKLGQKIKNGRCVIQ